MAESEDYQWKRYWKMLSERSYWIILLLGLTVFTVVDLIFIVPLSRDIGANFFTDAIFMMFTILFLSLLFDLRERRLWKPIKNKVIERLKDQMDDLFLLMQNLCEIPPNKSDSALIELSSLEKITLRRDISEYLSKSRYDVEGYIEILEKISHALHDVQVDYFRFMEAELANSLMVVEDCAQKLASHFRMLRMITWADEENEHKFFEQGVAPLVQEAIRELHKLYTMGIKAGISGGYRFTLEKTPNAQKKVY